MNRIWSETQKVKFALKKYIDMQKRSKSSNKSVQEIIDEFKIANQMDAENFLDPQIMKKYKRDNFKNSLFLTYLGKRKVWKAPKFMVSRKSMVAESYD